MRGRRATSLAAGLVVVAVLGTACSDRPLADPKEPPSTTPAPTRPAPTGTPTSSTTSPAPVRFDARRAMAHVRVLAGRIGPRLATGPAFRTAARYVERHLVALGYEIEREQFPVPAGDSWGVPVRAGRSFNVVASPPGLHPGQPRVLVGAHLDTVAVAPGAEDNASGVAVLLEIGRVLAARERVPVVLVAFGAEEPRGPGLHHFGSRHHVDTMPRTERRSLRAMVSLDRVGVGHVVPLSAAPGSDTGVRDALARAARRLGIPAAPGVDDASDHESFADAGVPAARIGSTPYAAYHSARDVPAVVQPEQLARVGRTLLSWLRAS